MSQKPIEVNKVSKTFNKGSKNTTKALDDVSFSLKQGEVTGLIGPNGAGKTTLMRIILGFESSDTGDVKLFGKSPFELEAREKIGFQSDSQFRTKRLSVMQFLMLNAGLSLKGSTKDEIVFLLETFHMTQAADKKLSDLSKGMRQKIDLINAFLNTPELVMLDEPTAALDPPSVFELRDFINKQKEKNVTVLFNSHHLTEVEKVCDRVLFINEGKLQGDYRLSEVGDGFLEEAFRRYEQERRFS
jgi:ABC-2 type transport system ATP-binding protein